MFGYCCGHATIVALPQPFFSSNRRPARCSIGNPPKSKAVTPLPVRTIYNGISPVRKSPRTARRAAPASWKKRATRFARSLQRPRFRAAPLRATDIRHPSCAKRIASFLCGWHFLRQFLTRDDAARDVRRRSRFFIHTSANAIPRDVPATFLIAAGNEARA